MGPYSYFIEPNGITRPARQKRNIMSITIESVIAAWNRAEEARNSAETLSAAWGTPSRIVGLALSAANALAVEHQALEAAWQMQEK